MTKWWIWILRFVVFFFLLFFSLMVLLLWGCMVGLGIGCGMTLISMGPVFLFFLIYAFSYFLLTLFFYFKKRHNQDQLKKTLKKLTLFFIILPFILLVLLKAYNKKMTYYQNNLEEYPVYKRGCRQIFFSNHQEEPVFTKDGQLKGIWITASFSVNKSGTYLIYPMEINGLLNFTSTLSDTNLDLEAKNISQELKSGETKTLKYFIPLFDYLVKNPKQAEIFLSSLKDHEEGMPISILWHVLYDPPFPMVLWQKAEHGTVYQLQKYKYKRGDFANY